MPVLQNLRSRKNMIAEATCHSLEVASTLRAQLFGRIQTLRKVGCITVCFYGVVLETCVRSTLSRWSTCLDCTYYHVHIESVIVTFPGRLHPAPSIVLPNQDGEYISHIALDIGGSLIKLVYFSPDPAEHISDATAAASTSSPAVPSSTSRGGVTAQHDEP